MRYDWLWPVRDDHCAEPSGCWMTHSSHAGANDRCKSWTRRTSPGTRWPSPTEAV